MYNNDIPAISLWIHFHLAFKPSMQVLVLRRVEPPSGPNVINVTWSSTHNNERLWGDFNKIQSIYILAVTPSVWFTTQTCETHTYQLW